MLHFRSAKAWAALVSGTLVAGLTWSAQTPLVQAATPVTYQSSAGFSGQQGAAGWSYQQFDGTSYTNLTSYDAAHARWQGGKAYLWVAGAYMHPEAGLDAVKRWTAPAAGSVTVTGTVALAASGGNGVQAAITHGSQWLWSADVTTTAAVTASTSAITVAAGDSLVFKVYDRGDTAYDQTQWDPTVTFTATAPATPATAWSATLGPVGTVPNRAAVPTYNITPDGHVSVLPDGNGRWLMFWSEFADYRTVGTGPHPEDQTQLTPTTPVFGGRDTSVCRWDNGGSWLMNVYRLADGRLVGFYHAEDHWCNVANPDGVAWKSIAVTYSTDDGVTWSPGQQIITSSASKPATPVINGVDQWGGDGDPTVIWDPSHSRWVAFYQDGTLRMAISTDPTGAPGSWHKYDNGSFSQPGLGGQDSSLTQLDRNAGANPSVHWNSYLDEWVMVWGGWDGNVYIASSTDLIAWSTPRVLATSTFTAGHAWYPTIIGDSDTAAGQTAQLYYADLSSDFTTRHFVTRSITFTRS